MRDDHAPETSQVPDAPIGNDQFAISVDSSKRSDWQHKYRLRLLLTDSLVVIAAVVIAQFVRYGSSPTSPDYLGYYVTAYSALIVVLWLAALAGFRTRSPLHTGSFMEEIRRLVSATLATFGAIAMAELLLKLEFSRIYLAVALPIGVLGLLLTRGLWRRHVTRRRAAGAYCTNVLVVGDKEMAKSLVGDLVENPMDGYRVVGVCLTDLDPSDDDYLRVNQHTIPIIGGANSVLHGIHEYGADTVAIAGTAGFSLAGLRRLMWNLEPMGVDLMVLPGVRDVALHRLVMRPVSGVPFLHVVKPLYQGTKGFQKRAFDIAFSLAALLAVLPLLLATAIAIKLTSKGPIFYRSERIGIDGKPFMMLKFRTMVQDADRQMDKLLTDHGADNPMFFKIKDDPRVTPIGRILRRFSIDELPQFINVLRNDMSVVGPRPQVRREVEAYDDDVVRRLLVKPGVTGLWQVSGRSDLPVEKAVRLDLSYVDNWSMIGDMLIIARTVGTVLAPQGAY